MITVTYNKADYNNPLYFRVDGHATEHGDVCVETSALCAAAVLYVKATTGYEAQIEDGLIVIDLKESGERLRAVFDAIMLRISMLCEQFPEDIQIE